MNIDIRKIRLCELNEIIQSDFYKNSEFIPISDLRAESYMANPNAEPNDFVLYLGLIDNKMVAFRSLWADVIVAPAKKERFAWCSGAWVHPGHRRKGYSEMLLQEANSDWDGKLMFSNYAPEAEQLILKTGWFKPVYIHKGARAYLFVKTQKLYRGEKHRVLKNVLFKVLDVAICLMATIRCYFLRTKKHEVNFETLNFTDDQCYKIIKKETLLFGRGEETLKWIFAYPWISNQATEESARYPFSLHSNSFYYRTVKVYRAKQFVGFFIFSVKDGNMKTLYFQIPDDMDKEVCDYFREYCAGHKIAVLSVNKKSIADMLFHRKLPFLYMKPYGQQIYSTFDISVPPGLTVQDGDGDVFFT